MAISFYIQGTKLMVAAYHVFHAHGSTRYEALHGETPISWLGEVLDILTDALHEGLIVACIVAYTWGRAKGPVIGVRRRGPVPSQGMGRAWSGGGSSA
ncbi:unnamed protein product [Cyprideis torosa]|uniref:Uncharacterized protein n=1 Tax=Cyprideis torosa TaxID=163714 RepID=A0A7R8WPI8_9CRUS|nr:unnamed protein product [Cyprideis torosa]CAG0900788.1 unnamed protein product [Cyprideis torosa]